MKRSWVGLLMKCSPFCREPAATKEVVEVDAKDGEGDHLPPANRRKPGGWRCMPFIIGNETFESVAALGITANFTIYLVKHFHMEQVAAASIANIFNGTINFAPLVGAFISDAYAGRFLTLAYSSIATCLGMVVLTLTAAVPQLQPPTCSAVAQKAGHCTSASATQMGVLYLSLALLTIGAGGIRPCSLPFGVDQFDKFTEDGRRGLNRFFNWYYSTSMTGVMVALTFIVYIQDKISWTVGFLVPTALMLLAILLFFIGTRLYVHVPPEGSVFSGVIQVFIAAFRNRSLPLPSPDNAAKQEPLLYNPPVASTRVSKLSLTLQYKCLNKAAIIVEPPAAASSRRLCSVQQVEEVKCLLRIIPIWASGIVCFLAMAQQWTFSVLQSLTMDRHLGKSFEIPAASVGVISLLALTLFIPIYDLVLVPVARRFTGIESGITLLQRQGMGMVVAAASMVVAGVVEKKRRVLAVQNDGVAPMSAMWLAPQLAMMGVGEALNAVGQIEFYNRQFPEQLQTFAGAFFFCSLAGSNYLSSGLVTVIKKKTDWLRDDINNGRLDYYFYVIAGMGVVNLMYFMVVSSFYRYKGATSELEAGGDKGEIVLQVNA